MRLRDRKPELDALDASLAAISVDDPAEARKMLARIEANGGPLGFPVLCDPRREAVKAFGVYDAEHDIALPSVLILDPSGNVLWKHIGDTMADRPEEDALLTELRRLRER